MSEKYTLQLSNQEFNSHLAAVTSGTNMVKEAKINTIKFVADCLYRYEENWSKDFLDAAASDVSYFPAIAKLFVAIFDGDNKPKIVHSVALNKTGISVKKNQRKKGFEYDKDSIAGKFLKSAMANVKKIHKPKPPAKWDNEKKFAQLQKQFKSHADYLVYVVTHLDAADKAKVIAALKLQAAPKRKASKTAKAA